MNVTVCHIIDNLAQGGAQTLLRDIVANSPESVTHEICVLGSDLTLASIFKKLDSEIYHCAGSFRGDPRTLLDLSRYLRNNQFDVIHTHLAYAQTFGRISGQIGASTPVLSTYHDVPQSYCPDWHMRIAEYFTRPLDSITVGVSEGVVNEFEQGWYFSNIADMIPVSNGIDIEAHTADVSASDAAMIRQELGIEGLPLYINVGRLAEKKRQRDLVDAVVRLQADENEFHLAIIGGGPLESELRAYVRDNSVDDIVTITGRVKTVAPYFAAADVYVHAALYEGFGLTIVEAMAAGLPVICTDVPGARDVVGNAGVRVSPKAPAELAEAMAKFTDEHQRQIYAARSKSQVQQFDIQKTVDQYCEYYLQLA